MSNRQIGPSWVSHRFLALSTFCFLGSAGIAYFMLAYGTPRDFELLGLSNISRTLNYLMAVVLTCMALILPLTSNLYSSRLVRLYVTHPLIVIGLSVLVLAQLVVIAAAFFPPDHPFSIHLIHVISLGYLLVLTTILPYLYGISQFLRPGYFMPMLTRRGIAHLRRLNHGRQPDVNARALFETVDVVTNIALTGMARGDRQLVLLSLQSLHTHLSETITSGWEEGGSWRDSSPFFVPGLAREGQDFLTRERVWPEAYLLAQMLKVNEAASKRQHELLAELGSHLVGTAQLAHLLGRAHTVELHVMAFNTLMREAIEERDLRRFQNLCYHYRTLAEAFHDDAGRLEDTAHHLIHYGGMAQREGLAFGSETVVYDVGELVLSLGRRDEARALRVLAGQAVPLFREAMDRGGVGPKVAWRTVIRLYWEARAGGWRDLGARLETEFLGAPGALEEQSRMALGENRELNFEFNDRLMRFAHLSPEAEALARAHLAEA